MEINQATLKAKVMHEMEVRLEWKLTRLKDRTELDLDEIEDLALEMERELGQVFTQVLDETQEEKRPGVMCPVCQQKLTCKGKKVRYLRTRSGEVQVQRPDYYSHCRSGHFPSG